MKDSERLQKVIDYLDISVNRFAVSIGKLRPNISNILEGKYKISKEIASLICERYIEINKNWLLTGEGEMLKQKQINYNVNVVNEQSENEADVDYKIETLIVKINELRIKLETATELLNSKSSELESAQEIIFLLKEKINFLENSQQKKI